MSSWNTPARLSLAIGCVVAVVVATSPNLQGRDSQDRALRPCDRVLRAVIVVLAYGLVAYNSNCLTAGGCRAWSWISILTPVLTGLLFLWAALPGAALVTYE